MIIETIKRVIRNPYKIFGFFASRGFFKWIPDKLFLELSFKSHFGKDLNLSEPKTFNEKIQWLKLYDRNPLYTTMVDKYEVKQYVSSIIGEEYIIPTLGVWDDFDQIDFDSLPEQFVLKCTHDSGGVVICKDKKSFDKYKARKVINKSLKKNYYWFGREWPYKDVKPRIIAEKYMEDSSTSELRDYKFFCFNGVAKCFKVDFDRFVEHHANYYDSKANLMKFGEAKYPPIMDKEIIIPSSISLMKDLAEKFSNECPFLRADFYDVDGATYFGELTFYPDSGFGNFSFEGNDELFGSWLKLPEESGGMIYITNDMVILLRESNKKNQGINDYKIHCFNGVPKIILVCKDRFGKKGMSEDFYDVYWNHIDVQRPNKRNSEEKIEKPNKLDEMLLLSKKLSVCCPFLRADFYEVSGKVFFGELTFYPMSGFEGFVPDKWDYIFGKLINCEKHE